MSVIKQLSNFLLMLILAVSCRTIQYIPIETNTNVRDSVSITYKDSTIYHHKTINKDYTGLLDTLHIYGERSSMSAYADTSNFTIKGELNEDPYVEKIIYRDRVEYRDSLVYQEKPVPVEVEKPIRYVPWYHKVLSAIGIIAIIAGLIFTVVKLKI